MSAPGEDRVEGGGELAVSVTDQEPEPLGPVTQVHQQVAGLLSDPGAGGMGGDSGDVHAAAAVLDHDQDVEAAQEDGVDVGEVDGEDRVSLRGQEHRGAVLGTDREAVGLGRRSGRGRSSSAVAVAYVVGVRRVGGAGPGSRSPCWCRIAPGARSGPGAWRTSGRSAAAPQRVMPGCLPWTNEQVTGRVRSFGHPQAGRPGRTGWVQRRATSWRCQRRIVAGVTNSPRRRGAGSSRVSAADRARSAQLSLGRLACRRSTVSW